MSSNHSGPRGSSRSTSADADERPSAFSFSFNGLSLNPFGLASSKSARRASLAAASFALASLPLLALAALAYAVFYYHYVPVRGFAEPAHFQFGYLAGEGGDGAAAARAGKLRAAVRLPDGLLVAGQAYDVAVELRMPRVARNVEAGNFMVDLRLLAGSAPTATGQGGGGGGGDDATTAAAAPVVARERRPASLTYRSPPVEWARRALALPLYVVGWWREEERVAVPLMEGVTFAAAGRRRGAALPTDARIEILTDARLQVYSARISFRTRLKGLRYMMYNFRTFSFVLFTGMFWAVEMSVAAAVWIYLVMFTPKDEDEDVPKEESTDVKTEDDPGRPVKEEEADIESGTEADVEDTEGPITAVRAHGRLDPDSGVGTSAEGASAVSVRRRPSVKQEEG